MLHLSITHFDFYLFVKGTSKIFVIMGELTFVLVELAIASQRCNF